MCVYFGDCLFVASVLVVIDVCGNESTRSCFFYFY